MAASKSASSCEDPSFTAFTSVLEESVTRPAEAVPVDRELDGEPVLLEVRVQDLTVLEAVCLDDRAAAKCATRLSPIRRDTHENQRACLDAADIETFNEFGPDGSVVGSGRLGSRRTKADAASDRR